MKIDTQSKKQLIKPIVWLWQKRLFDPESKEKGQTLVIAFMLGLIVLGATILGVLKSTQSKTKVQADEFAARAVATAEQGIADFTEQLGNDYKDFLRFTYNPPTLNEWADPPAGATSVCAPIDGSIIPEVTLSDGRSYEVVSYIYDSANSTGELTIRGTEPQGPSNSQAQIRVQYKIVENELEGSFPGLYGSDFVALGGADIEGQDGNVICTDCIETYNLTQSDCVNDELPITRSLDATNNGSVEGQVILGDPQLPPVPAPPAQQCQQYDPILDNDDDCYIVLPPITADTTLPRPADVVLLGLDLATPPTNRTFYYVLQNSGNPQYRSIGSNNTLTIDSTLAPIRLYVTGNYNQSGTNGATDHNGTIDEFAIYGCTDDLHTLDIDGDGTANTNCEPPNADGEYVNQEFALSGGATTTRLFLYAPDAQAGINGGSGDPVFEGVIWARTWGSNGNDGVGSNSNVANVAVPDGADETITNTYWPSYTDTIGVEVNGIGSISGWTREAVQ